MKYIGIARKTASILANVSLLLNNFLPFILAAQPVRAQSSEEDVPIVEVINAEPTKTPTPEVTPEIISTPSPESTPIPEPTVEPTPEITITPTKTPIPEVTPEIISTPSPESTPIPEPTVEPTPTPENTPTVVPTPTATPKIEQVCLDDNQAINNSVSTDWNRDDTTNFSETKEKVQLGVKYNFPQEEKVSVTFKCLPKDESLRTTLKIQQIQTSDLNLPDDSNVGEYAYDITTGMADGTFEYDVTLPKPADKSAKISYIEKSLDDAKANIAPEEIKPIEDNKTEQQSETVKATDVDHFTIFLVTAEPIATTSNPTLSQACGLDIALVIDNSTSIDSGELTQIKNAMTSFVNALDGTPTWFSVTKFGNTANVIRTFTSDISLVNAAIDGITVPGGISYTNWQDALTKAQGTFSSARADKPDLIIFASDGNPNRTGPTGTNVSESQAVADAVIVANTIKANTRILAIGVGGDLDTANLISISGPNLNTGSIQTSDVITTNFNTLATALGEFAKETCGGTITVNKYIDSISESNRAGTGWTYTVSGPNSYTKNLTTDGQGQDNTGKVSSGPGYSLVETNIPTTHTYGSTICKDKSGATIGSQIANGWGNITVSDDSAITCNVINILNKTDLLISKSDSPDPVNNGGTLTYTLTVNNLTTVPAENVIVGDTLPSGFSATSVTPSVGNCSDTIGPEIKCELGTLAGSASATVTIVGTVTSTASSITNSATVTTTTPETSTTNNNDSEDTVISQKGHLIVQKTTVPSNDPTDFTIDLLNSSGTIVSTDTVSDSTDKDFEVVAGTYSINETVPSGWGQTSNTCVGVTVPAGQTQYCTIENKKLPVLTVEKVLIGENTPYTNFSFKVDGGTATTFESDGTNQTYIVPGQSYTITEVDPGPNYNVSYSAGCSGNLTYNQTATCTITNTKYGSLTIVKNASPDSTQSFAFTTSGVGLTYFSLSDDGIVGHSNSKTFTNLLPGTYSVAESNVSGWDLNSATCSDNSSVSAINLSAGENIACTFTNTMRGAIGGHKYNDLDGNSTTTNDQIPVSGWTIELWQNGLKIGETTTAGINGSYGFSNLVPGEYKVKEGLPDGWFPLFPLPSGDGFINITLNPGENDFGNDFINTQSASVTIYKNVDDDGDGDIDITNSKDWIWNINGAGDYKTGNIVSRLSPATYSFSEEHQDGYHVTSLICNNGVGGIENNYGAVESQSIDLKSGQDLICTFTNTRDTGTLRIVKDLKNDNGGTLSKSDFSFKINGVGNESFESDGINEKNVPIGKYNIVENSVNGYTTTYNNCTDVNVSYGQTTTCIITNDDIAPSLVLNKVLINNNGGNAVESNWTLTADGGNAGKIEGVGTSGDIDVQSGSSFKAGTYTLTENGPAGGYSSSSWSCIKNGNPAVNGSSISLELGDSATCTITNNDVAPTLKVIKNVVNDNGGNAVIGNFEIKLNDTLLTFDSGTTDGSKTVYTANPTAVSNISYTLSEKDLPGYVEGSWACLDDVTGVSISNPFTFNEGQSITCTITNDDIAPKLTLIKSVTKDNGGNAQPNDFSLKVGDSSVLSGVKNTYMANTPYTLNEKVLAGYSFVSITGDSKCPEVLGGTVTLDEGEDITCTITNDDIAPKLTLVKTVVNDNGGKLVVSDFPLFINGVAATSGTAYTQLANVKLTASETNQTGYSASVWGGNCAEDGTITLLPGDNKTCTITNDDIAPQLKVVKEIVPKNDPGKFNLSIGGTEYVSNVGHTGSTGFQTVRAGTVNFSETAGTDTDLSNYTTSYSSGCENRQTTLSIGESKVCTITNTRKTVPLYVSKFEDLNNNQTVDEDERYLDNWTFELYDNESCEGSTIATAVTNSNDLGKLGTAKFENLYQGKTYWIKEIEQDGWNSTTGNCRSYTIHDDINSNNHLLFGNQPIGTIHGYKWNDLNGDQVLDVGESLLPGWTINLYRALERDIYEETPFKSMVTSSGDYYGWYWFENLLPGNYKVCEVPQNGWRKIFSINDGCHLINLPSQSSGFFDSDNLELPTYNFSNQQLATVNVTKFNDINGNGHQDDGEEVLPDWTINLTGQESLITDENGQVLFNNLIPGEYDLSENLSSQPGWKQTNIYCEDQNRESYISGSHLTFTAGQNKICYIGNQHLAPKITIAKSNNTNGSELSPGNSVQYTISLGFTGSSINNLKVTDLLSDGFKYRDGSYKILRNGHDVTSLVEQPQYHSPGVWNLSTLGELTPEDKLELIYTADISTDQQSGKYADLAYAMGINSYNSDDAILATAQPEGYIADNFVGTLVPVNKPLQNSIIADVEKIETKEEGQVLGAFTELPSTGATTLWLVISSILGLLGLILLNNNKLSKSMTKKILSILILPLFLFLATAQIVSAVSSIVVRLEEPKSPTNTNDLQLKFVALDINGNPITVKCLKKGPSDSDFVQYGSDIPLSAGGNASQCTPNSIMNQAGSYQFKVNANGFDSNTVTVSYNNVLPGTPNDYRKEKINNCDYKIHFKTAADEGKTVRVEIYRSDLTSFIADNGSKVGDINVGSNEERDFTNSVSDCSKTYYYAVRAFDSAGNGSGIVGDSFTTVKTSSTTTSSVTSVPAQGAIMTTGSSIPSESSLTPITSEEQPENQEQLENEEQPGSQEESGGQVLGTETVSGNFFTDHKIFSAFIVLVILISIIFIIKKISKSKNKFTVKKL